MTTGSAAVSGAEAGSSACEQAASTAVRAMREKALRIPYSAAIAWPAKAPRALR